MAKIIAAEPRAYCLHGEQIRANIKRLKRAPKLFESAYGSDSFLVPPALQAWVDIELPKKERAKCLILVGESRLGKTQWARSLRPLHMFFRGAVNVKAWNDAAELLIIDDMGWKWIPHKKQLLTQMGECCITGKYCPVTNIVVGMPAIVLMNDTEFNTLGEESERADVDPYWVLNAVYVRINEPLF